MTSKDNRVVLLGQQAQHLDVLLGDAQLHCLIPARRLDRFDRLANALGRGPPDERDGGGRSHSRVELLLLGATAGGGRLSVAGPGGLVKSGPELHTEVSRPRAGVHGNPLATGPSSEVSGFRTELRSRPARRRIQQGLPTSHGPRAEPRPTSISGQPKTFAKRTIERGTESPTGRDGRERSSPHKLVPPRQILRLVSGLREFRPFRVGLFPQELIKNHKLILVSRC